MATHFEVALWGGDRDHLDAAAYAALDEIERLHAQLSAFDPASDMWDLNARAACEPVRVEPRLFGLLQRCIGLSGRTRGAFDITVGALMAFWGFHGEPQSADGDVAAGVRVGSDLIELDADAFTVRYRHPSVRLDLGAVGKGYALDCAADILAECGIGGGLLHGGTSSVVAIGGDPDGEAWRVAIREPSGAGEPVAIVALRDRALGVSAPHGRTVRLGGTDMGHVMDPRSGRPAEACRLAAVACESACDADALSTALLVLGASLEDDLRAQGCDTWTV